LTAFGLQLVFDSDIACPVLDVCTRYLEGDTAFALLGGGVERSAMPGR